MAKIDDLTRQVSDPRLRRELEAAVAELKKRTRFGLVYESHLPEVTALPGLPISEGALVVRREKLSARHAFRVTALDGGTATLLPVSGGPEVCAPVSELFALQKFGEPIFPGLARVGSVECGGPERGHHVVINGENYHVLKTLTWTHTGKVDAIYIDPPYNTGARDWKYNNDYVEGDDLYRHSKWLAMMERRLRLARELLNPADSVLIVTIDEKEYLRLGLLLEQIFPEANIQMVSVTISPRGTNRPREFSRIDEYVYFVFIGNASPGAREVGSGTDHEVRWQYLRRDNTGSERVSGRPNQFYPIFISTAFGCIAEIGAPLGASESREKIIAPSGTVAVFPVKANGREMVWGLTGSALKKALAGGFVRLAPSTTNPHQPYTISYVTGVEKNLSSGVYEVTGKREDGSSIVVIKGGKIERTSTVWRDASHDAGAYGTSILGALIPGRKFPFPKSLFAVEDCLRVVTANKPNAVILDFFAGSGTTAHAVMRLNKQDGGRRQSISVTNNEVSADEAKALREQCLRPGDPEWERWGIFEHITKPRIEAAITGKTPDGQPIQGDYKFTDEFPMVDGFDENVTFFRFDYLNPDQVDMGRQFDAIAPLLWLQSGAVGAWEGDAAAGRGGAGFSLPPGAKYGVLFRESKLGAFCEALAQRPDVTHVYIVTNNEDAYVQARAALPPGLTARRLYRDYLRSFRLKEATGGEGGGA